MSRKILS